MNDPIIVVSGLPRSGTSLMMQMLARCGMEVVTDHVREADADNPRGYIELEKVKKLKEDASWLPEMRGKALKMVSQLLYDLPTTESYRVIFMERDLDEMITSQDKMLDRLGRESGPRDQVRKAFRMHLEKIRGWLSQQPHLAVLYVRYDDLMADPPTQSRRVSEFLDNRADALKMCEAVDPSLYRNRRGQSPTDKQ